MREVSLCLTFDVDFVEHTEGDAVVDEFERAFPAIWPLFEAKPTWTATWFIRLDGRMEAEFGRADHIFRRYDAEIRALRRAGHEVGWHPHVYARDGDGWTQNTDGPAVARELERYAPLARAHGLEVVRLGWGFHSGETMRALVAAGFAVDASAIPRPRYAWETGTRDWEPTPPDPYIPGEADHRLPGTPALGILEIPISTAAVPAPYDDGTVIRYLNFAYRPEILRPVLERWLAAKDVLVPITHPYELVGGARHGLLAFHPDALTRNVGAVEEITAGRGESLRFSTISQLAERYRSIA